MDRISLENGVIILDSINKEGVQDYIEVKLKDGNIVLITASCNGCLKIGLKLDSKFIGKT